MNLNWFSYSLIEPLIPILDSNFVSVFGPDANNGLSRQQQKLCFKKEFGFIQQT